MTTNIVTGGLTEAEEQKLVELLGKVGQPWSSAFYNSVAPLMRRPTNDLILMNRAGSIFMTQRPADDAFEPFWWHFPGTVVSEVDKSNADGLARIGKKELGLQEGQEFLERIKFARYICEDFSDSRRGPEINRYFLFYIPPAFEELIGGIGRFVSREEFGGLQVLEHHQRISIWDKI